MSLFLGKSVIIPLCMDLCIDSPGHVNHDTSQLYCTSLLLLCISQSAFITDLSTTLIICTTDFLSQKDLKEGLGLLPTSASCVSKRPRDYAT